MEITHFGELYYENRKLNPEDQSKHSKEAALCFRSSLENFTPFSHQVCCSYLLVLPSEFGDYKVLRTYKLVCVVDQGSECQMRLNHRWLVPYWAEKHVQVKQVPLNLRNQDGTNICQTSIFFKSIAYCVNFELHLQDGKWFVIISY